MTERARVSDAYGDLGEISVQAEQMHEVADRELGKLSIFYVLVG